MQAVAQFTATDIVPHRPLIAHALAVDARNLSRAPSIASGFTPLRRGRIEHRANGLDIGGAFGAASSHGLPFGILNAGGVPAWTRLDDGTRTIRAEANT